ncbi:zonular occludens toxin family protein [Pseudoalteromonas rubra]|uniref:zonular occludens toxin family protein n=1 Tax=Pseudoalteromonas rubra TaxID=43658 RepID=UPI000696D6FC|nr:zonular occludens toxin domain-containing protein [Pseudoalteromonas rubra]
MIIFHEGLPGSGKSYEATVAHILPALKSGRRVYARLNGFNFAMCAQLIDKSEQEVRDLYIEISEDDVQKIPEIVTNDSLVIIDEMQNFFRSGRQKLTDEMTQFIAEHRHRGIDIIGMGQALADVHTTWRRRIERKITFLKLSMVGLDNKYKWEMYQGSINGEKGDIVFHKIKSGSGKYDEKYFGLYASHQAETDNTDVYSDDRVNIFKSPAFRIYLPVFVCVVIAAIWYLVSLFSGDVGMVNGDPKTPQSQQAVQPQPSTTSSVKHTPNTQPNFNDAPKSAVHPYQKIRETIQNNSAYITYEEVYKGQIVDLLLVVQTASRQTVDVFSRNELLMLGYRLRKTELGIEAYYKDVLAAVFRYKPNRDVFRQIPDDVAPDLKSDIGN